ncbi:glycosyltransferase family 90 protein [Calocera viscosa TUFC12733]|uniref:Glycosyltransferase family 90 protein n=1 Tax=Calocera viscosa (strain TUFC12733) TaxID=1330018 RepID=A0A167GQH4_CALVF|nr:glycosyltransferase family 90 protein [Calocera viscosa TUFC12733]
MLRNPRLLPYAHPRRGQLTTRPPLHSSLRSLLFNLWRRTSPRLRLVLLALAGLALFFLLLRPGRPAVPRVGVRVQLDLDALTGAEQADLLAQSSEEEDVWMRDANQEIFAGEEDEPEAPPLAPVVEEPPKLEAVPDPPISSSHHNPLFLPRIEGLSEHRYLPNGLLEVNPAGRHPMYDLIERAEQEWEEKLARASTTIEQAVAEYTRRYKRKPPRGFDKWWAYVKRHNVQLPDEYDQILSDLEMFYAYSPADLRRLQTSTRQQPGTYTLGTSPATGTLQLVTHHLSEEEQALGLLRAREQLELMQGYDEEWVDEQTGRRTNVQREIVRATGEWEATFGAHDGPSEFGDWAIYEERRQKVRAREFTNLFKKSQTEYMGWASACPPDTPLRQEWPAEPSLPLDPPSSKTFIYDHRLSMNPCAHPSLVHTAGFLLSHPQRGPAPAAQHRLVFATCKTQGLHGDVLHVATENWVEEVGADPEWEDKPDERLVWRGSNTGVLAEAGVRWEASQRMRLVRMVNEHRALLNYSVLLPASDVERVGQPEPRPQAWMNHLLTDGAFAGEPIQCTAEACEALLSAYEFRELMTPAEQALHKYVLDIDGNGWSARFKRLLTSRALVLKSTIFPEWWQDRVQPWVHYVPVQVDLSDLYDVMVFFRGDVAQGGEGAHDALARQIAYAGREWSLRFWRREDMVAYTWRLFLEYGRLVNDERNEMNFELP